MQCVHVTCEFTKQMFKLGTMTIPWKADAQKGVYSYCAAFYINRFTKESRAREFHFYQIAETSAGNDPVMSSLALDSLMNWIIAYELIGGVHKLIFPRIASS